MRVTSEQTYRNPRHRSRSVVAAVLLGCLLILFVIAATLAPRKATSAAEPSIVARVNGEPLAWAEFQRMRANPLTLRQLQQELDVRDPDAQDKELDRLALQRLINRRLLIQEAGLKRITVTEKELDKAIATLRRSFKDLESFGVWMKQQDLDEQTLFASVHADMLATRVSTALVEEVRVTDKQVQQYYESHKDDLKADEVRLQIIVVKDKVTAEKVLTALREGKDFASLARQLSIGRRAAKGGDTGWVSSETLWPPLQTFVGAMKAGEAGGPLQKGNEFLIVRLEARRPGKTKTLAGARPQIEPRLLAAKRQEVVRDWLAAREKEAKIEVFLRPDPR